MVVLETVSLLLMAVLLAIVVSLMLFPAKESTF